MELIKGKSDIAKSLNIKALKRRGLDTEDAVSLALQESKKYAEGGPVLSSYEPTIRDKIASFLIGDQRPSPEKRAFVSGLMGGTGLGAQGLGLADMTPLGIPMQAQEAAREGDYQGAAMAVTPFGVGAKANRFLHGTTREAIPSIRSNYLEPQAGPFVQSAYGGEYANAGAELPNLVYMAAQDDPARAYNAIRSQVATQLNKSYHSVTPAEIRQHGAMVVARPDARDVFEMGEDQVARDLRGKDSYLDYDRIATAEPGDWFSTETVRPSGFLTGDRLTNYLTKQGLMEKPNFNPIRAYHGSPHDFDKFDLSKIGTGEGAQSYGHGLYFAENPIVAEEYKRQLSRNKTNFSSANKKDAEQWLAEAGGDKDLAIKRLDQFLLDTEDQSLRNRISDAANILRGKDFTPGRMYEVNIHADPNKFLDWDAPLSGQHETVQKAITDEYKRATLWPVRASDLNEQTTAKELRSILNYQHNTKKLFESGIPGIKYLDQGSRGSGQGTRNYVVFDPSIIEIIRKYGIAGLPAAGVAAGAMGGEGGDMGFGGGGAVDRAMQTARNYAQGGPVTGFLHTEGPGRTDNIPADVPSGSYVIPADIVSALGEGNTLAGKRVIEELFGPEGEYGKMKRGGVVRNSVPVIMAGGEFVLSPEDVEAVGDGDLKEGHERLDAFVVNMRKKLIKTLSKLPPPAKD